MIGEIDSKEVKPTHRHTNILLTQQHLVLIDHGKKSPSQPYPVYGHQHIELKLTMTNISTNSAHHTQVSNVTVMYNSLLYNIDKTYKDIVHVSDPYKPQMENTCKRSISKQPITNGKSCVQYQPNRCNNKTVCT